MTHEQADFDALAALLAAGLLSDAAQPVLPSRINRNARKFINLYRPELPFVEFSDLTHESIDAITLVDTQSLVTPKGINKKTKIRVVDHHKQRSDLPGDWELLIENVGATTTILCEALQERAVELTSAQATLLLLGIYEDTGSLTYASTTARDIRAAAHLVEKGASLRIAADYLNPALSPGQRALAETLMENASTRSVQGKSVLVAQADAREMSEEISSIAHKLRDLLDPDALFLVVLTNEGIRIVARSSCDEINVARILSAFGGGGHERAASALIAADESKLKTDLKGVLEQLADKIDEHIQPGVTVQKIMSKKPLLLTPETTLNEADTLMQRYGYEGYPVVEAGKVVGLLTRRAVDKARNHHLNLNICSLMDSGSYTLQPTDNLDAVQDLMAATGWGQIPVIDMESRKIIGIVTRTDLLKNLHSKERKSPAASNYSTLLEKALPPCRLSLLKAIIQQSSEEHLALFIVGGFVRDLILKKPSLDFDIVVEGDAIAFARSLANRYGGRVVTHRRFGTAKWKIREIHHKLARELGGVAKGEAELPEDLDLISARTEFYDKPTALPVVKNSSIKQDLHRRDFTINTLALRLDGAHYGELQDHWGGLNDIKAKSIKVLHSLSFVDDPTRMLRAVRFEQRFGFRIDERTLQLIKEARENFKQVSGDRIRHEFDLLLKEADPGRNLQRLKELDLLSAVQNGLDWQPAWGDLLEKALKNKIEAPWDANQVDRTLLVYLAWFIHLDEQAARDAAERLHFSNTMVKTLEASQKLIENQTDLAEMPVSKFCEQLRSVPEAALFLLDMLVEDVDLHERILRFLAEWRDMQTASDGETLKKMGIPPGPRFSEILKRLKDARLDGEIKNDQEEKDLLERLTLSI